jgi:hypothetical protein
MTKTTAPAYGTFSSVLAALATLVVTLVASVTFAAPTINSVSLRGLQTGATTTIAIDGYDLVPEPRLMLPVAIAKQSLYSGATPQHVEFEVTLGDVTPGIYNLRLATPGGISNPLLIGVDSLAQIPVAPQISALPAAISGTIGGGQMVQTSFNLKKGEQIAIEVESKRLGSALDPVIHLLDPRKLPLAWAEAMTALGGDARLSFTAPADGQYTLQLHDSVYQAGSPGHFRLKIGAWQYADIAFPPAVRRGSKANIEFACTNLPAGSKAEISMPADGGDQPAPWPAGIRSAGFRPRVLASDDEQVLKAPPGDGSPQQVTAPAGINGRLDTPHSEDRYRVTVVPGMKLRIEVTASRIGSPLDGVLFVRDEKGNQLAMSDDQADTVDPGLDFTVPGDKTAIVLALKDVAGRGGPDFVYHVGVSRLDRPDFSLALAADRYLIPAAGNGLMRITANRRGYKGPIKLAFNGLPPTVKPMTDEIPAGSNLALVALAGQPDSAEPAVISIVGRGKDGDREIVRTALTPAMGSESARMPWLRTEVAVAQIASPAFGLAWADLSAEPTFKIGGKAAMAVKLTRGAGATTPVRLSLVTSQPMPKKKVKVNNQDQEQDDPDRALRLEGSPTIAAGATDGTVQILVPGVLPVADYDIAIRGELLAADSKSTIAETYTPVLRTKAIAPPPEKTPLATTPSNGPDTPFAIFEDQPEIVANLNQGGGQITLVSDDKFSGKAAVKVTPDQRYNPTLPGLTAKIRQNPGPGEYRYVSFAWKKKGGSQICFQLNHDGNWGPPGDSPARKFRYHAGSGPECYGASLLVDSKLPDGWTLVTRDLFIDFGEFTLTGIALTPMDGEYALFDHIYLARKPGDFDQLKK